MDRAEGFSPIVIVCVALAACVPAGADRDLVGPAQDDPEDPTDPGGPGPLDDPRLAAFYPVFRALNPIPSGRQRCAACHGGQGPGRPAHSQDDLRAAYAAALTVITPDDPMASRLYSQAVLHEPAVGVEQFSTEELDALLAWIELEKGHDAPPPLPEVGPLLENRRSRYALALSAAALRVAQVPADLAELLDIADQPDAEGRRAAYERYVERYLEPSATPIEAPDALGYARPGLIENVFYNPDVAPGAERFSLTTFDFDSAANRGYFHFYPSALSRFVLQWIGFEGVLSARDNPTVANQDNFGALDALMQNILADRPVKEAFATTHAGGETRACHHVPFSGYDVPVMTRQVCRRNGTVDEASPSGEPVPGGIIGSRAFQRVRYGHYKFHTVRSLFRSFHCKDFPLYNNDLVDGEDDSASRARVVAPWNETGTRPYCASCHANSNLNLMALAFWRFEDETGVLRDRYVAVRPTNDYVQGPTDIVSAGVDASKYYYKDQVLDSFQEWTEAFVADPDFIRCTAAQVYNFAMGRGNASNPEHAVPGAKVDELLSAYEAEFGPKEEMSVLRMLEVVLKSRDFTDRLDPTEEILESDPCPEQPSQQYGCEALASARRISWYGWLAKWMQIYRVFGVPESGAGGYASVPADQLGLAYGHPDQVLEPLVDTNNASQYVTFHDLLGEPMDDFGVEATTIAAFRAQHSLHLTAGAVKQACRISTNLAARLAGRIAQAGIPATEAALAGRVVEMAGNDIRAFKPELGLLVYGRLLEPSELEVINGALTEGARFETALSALMCSTMAMVE